MIDVITPLPGVKLHIAGAWAVFQHVHPCSKGDARVRNPFCSLGFAKQKSLKLVVCLQRLMRDFKRLQNDPPQGVNGSPKSDSIMLWNAVIFGPDDTPWDGGDHAVFLSL